MKTLVTIAILGAMGLAGAAGAEANEGRRQPERRPARHRTIRNHREQHRRVWIPPRYECRTVGYECGRPITREVLVQPGYWSIQTVCD